METTEKELVACTTCNGAGVLPDDAPRNAGKTCPVCRGDGMITRQKLQNMCKRGRLLQVTKLIKEHVNAPAAETVFTWRELCLIRFAVDELKHTMFNNSDITGTLARLDNYYAKAKRAYRKKNKEAETVETD